MAPLPRKLLIVHQHLHKATPDGIGASTFAIGCIRMVTDEFVHVTTLIPVQAAREDELELIALYPDNVHPIPLYERSATTSKLEALALHVRSIPRIVREVRDTDIVYARWPGYPSFAAALLAVVARKELMVSIHGNYSEVMRSRGFVSPLWRAFGWTFDSYQRFLTRFSSVTMVTGDHTRHLASGEIRLFDQHQFEDRHLFVREDTCLTRPIRLIYVGGWSRNKGVDVLFDALATVRADGHDCALTLVGSPQGLDVPTELKKRGLTRHVHLAGYVNWGEELFALYRQSDIFVFPSLSEGVPKAPMEALSQGLPVVATVPGTSTYIDHEDSGLLVPPGDASALARAIARMCEDGELRQRCIKRGLDVARSHTRDRTQANIRAILHAAFGGGDTGA